MRILLSGFEKFGGEDVNPTEQLMRSGVKSDTELRAIVLPVTFRDAFARLEEAIREFRPDAIVCFGLAVGRNAVEFERVAINCMDANIEDNAGEQPRDVFIEEGGEPAYFSTLPIRKMSEALLQAGIPSRVSNTAGLYVCNALMYRLLASQKSTGRVCGFVHVPLLPEQAEVRNPKQPSLSLETLKRALEIIIKTLQEHRPQA